ncbi:MlaD family protein [Hydrogenimonas cancrithermarum]|uniref:Paraquat-inducible protein B n=1 Tax=Hydrogenimonas cancrithermarum TaxID=2993563 RepID=A0ABM8FIH5_9BACT|nr:MlaD family protein [Hydrogenimonas cancrithermarum]BDY12089.1 paraquat-inducible protein B [Hydrogenimonas cancrithermarum]
MNDTKHEIPHAVQKGRGTLWLVWLIPLVALGMTAWLIYKHYAEMGTDVVVVFENGNGLEVDKTPLLYKGIKIGRVSGVTVDRNDLFKVDVTITVDPDAVALVARKGTHFIKVEPHVSMTEISGLDTIISGVYVDLYPAAVSKEKILRLPKAYRFEGDTKYPPKRYDKGFYLTLRAEKGSVSINAPVLFNHFVVGKVIDKRLVGGDVVYTLFIEDQYRSLVKQKSRFWKVSGIDVKASLSGVKVRFDSIASLLAGGIAFSSPDKAKPATSEASFRLYDSRLASRMEEDLITLTADEAYNIDPELSHIYYRGFEVGEILDVRYDAQKEKTLFTIRLDQSFRLLANEAAWFRIVRPKIGFDGIKGLSAIASGPYITFDTAKIGAPVASRFILHDEPMPLKGRHIRLLAKRAESVRAGTTVFYRNIAIGKIESVRFGKKSERVEIDAVIAPKYADFVNDSSMFYVRSGVELDVSMHRIRFDSGSFETMVKGGIVLETPVGVSGGSKSSFVLYEDFAAYEKARYLVSGGTFFHVLMKELDALNEGAPVLYRKLKAGEVVAYDYLPEKDMIDVKLYIDRAFAGKINASTRFQNVSGLSFEMAFPDIKIETGTLESMIRGGLSFETPDPNASAVDAGHCFDIYDEEQEIARKYDRFVLWMRDGGEIKKGSPLLYKNIRIGRVEKVLLEGNMVKATVLIEKRSNHLLHSDTIFWLRNFELGVGGVQNPSAVVMGPAIALLPGREMARSDAFVLSETPPPRTYGEDGLRIELIADRKSSLKRGSPVLYRQVEIGEVESFALSDDATHVSVGCYIAPRYAHLVRKNARFYMAGALGMEVSLLGVKVQTETLATMIQGGIGMAVPDAPDEVVEEGARFKLYNEAEKEWMRWRPKL